MTKTMEAPKTKQESRIKKYDTAWLKKLLHEMLLIRRFEEKCDLMYGLKKIGGFCHLYIGQEAVSTGCMAALDLKKDYVLTSYRDHAHALSCGMHPNVLMAELFGKITGCSKGKGGSMHLFDAKKNMLGGNGIVGSQIPVATGVAFKIKYNNEDGVVLCFFGDGAIHQGAFHESLNMAKLWNLPIIYICENNMYGMGTSVSRASSVCNLSIKSAAYGIPGKQVNGMDVLEVYEELKSSIKRAREDKTPSFLEMKTYRYKGHSKSDPEKYRTTEELNKFKQDDPIIALKALLVEANEFSEEEYQQMEDEIKLLCEESVKFAEESPEPPLEELYEDVFV